MIFPNCEPFYVESYCPMGFIRGYAKLFINLVNILDGIMAGNASGGTHVDSHNAKSMLKGGVLRV